MTRTNWRLIAAMILASLIIQLALLMLLVIEPRGDFFDGTGFHLLELALIALAAIGACLATAMFIHGLSRVRTRDREGYILAAIMISYSAVSILFFFIIPGTWGIVA